MAVARAAVSKNNKQKTLNDRVSPNPTPPLPSFFHLLAPSLSALLCFSSPLKPLLKHSIFKFPSFSCTSLSTSRLSASAARAGAFRNEKQKILDDGATTSRSSNPTPPPLPSFFHLMLRQETPPYKDTNPTAQPKEEEDPSLSIDDRIAALGKKPIDFKPHSAAFWKDGEPVPFLFLARALDLIAGESRRIVITEILCNVFRTVMATTPRDLTATVYLSANRIAPSHEGVELGIGDAMLIKALGEAYGRNERQIKNQLKGLGDLGLVANGCCSSQSLLCRPSPLTTVKVLDTFRIIAKHLYDSFEELPGTFQFATAIISSSLEEIQKIFETAINNSCEGLIIKKLIQDATYEPSKRSLNWLKLKRDYMDSIGDSLDLVPIAAFHGRGEHTGVYGSFLLACYDEKNEEYQSICIIGTGFSDHMLEERFASLRDKPYYRCGDAVSPDVWFEPREVWEVKAAALSISSVHYAACGIVDPKKGVSLQFSRFLRVREDKAPDEATTSEQVAEMYRSQKINHANNQEDYEDD